MKVLVWDFDGTLAYCDGRWTLTMFRMLEAASPASRFDLEALRAVNQDCFPWHAPEIERPAPADADDWWKSMHPHFIRAFRAGGADEELAAALAPRVRQHYLERSRWSVFPDTIPTLQALSADGWKHVVLSNHVPELPEIIDHLGLTSHFHRVLTSATSGFEKPNPKAYATAVSGLGPIEDVWMIGDSMTADVGGAECFGWKAILVRETHPDAKWRSESLHGAAGIIREYARS